MENEPEYEEGYKSLKEALLAHCGIITFLGLIILAKLGVFSGDAKFWVMLIGSLAGVWGIFELMGSKFRVLATIGWIIAALWMLFGNTGILRGY